MKHDKKQEVLIDAVSWIDEDIVDQGLKKRFLLWKRKKFPKKLILSAVSVAACLSIVLTGTLAYLHHRDKIGDNTPIPDKNIPVYLGMTVENTPPIIQSAQKNGDLPFRTLRRHNRSTPFGALALHRPAYSALASDVSVRLLSNTTEGIDALTENESMDIFGESYYAMPNEDIYIHIHINNPAEYEILSFTLNGIKYSSYMFEPGSDMENLILKYNIGNVSGLQEYTIDAIKYVDGELIKDVKMQGDQTVRVEVNGGNGTLTLRAESEFETIAFTTEWADGFTGERELVALEIYENDTLLLSLSPDTRKISGLPLGKRLLLKASYMDGETKKTVAHVFKTPSSEGLKMVNGEIVGMGTCTDPILYFDAPITGPLITEASQLNYVTEVYFTKNVTFIKGLFESENLKKVVLGEGFSLPLRSWGETVPSGPNLTDVTIPVSVTEIEPDAIRAEKHLNIWYGGTKAQWNSVKKYYGNEPYDPTCKYEPSITARSYTIHCSDGTIDVVYNETKHTATIRYN